jgi:hypothetical protein
MFCITFQRATGMWIVEALFARVVSVSGSSAKAASVQKVDGKKS